MLDWFWDNLRFLFFGCDQCLLRLLLLRGKTELLMRWLLVRLVGLDVVVHRLL